MIDHNVAVVINRLGPLAGSGFGLDRASLVWVEEFLGQCLVAYGAGSWVERDEGWCVHTPRIDAFPFAKVAKQARHGLAGGDSIVTFFDLVVETSRTPFPGDTTSR